MDWNQYGSRGGFAALNLVVTSPNLPGAWEPRRPGGPPATDAATDDTDDAATGAAPAATAAASDAMNDAMHDAAPTA